MNNDNSKEENNFKETIKHLQTYEPIAVWATLDIVLLTYIKSISVWGQVFFLISALAFFSAILLPLLLGKRINKIVFWLANKMIYIGIISFAMGAFVFVYKFNDVICNIPTFSVLC